MRKPLSGITPGEIRRALRVIIVILLTILPQALCAQEALIFNPQLRFVVSVDTLTALASDSNEQRNVNLTIGSERCAIPLRLDTLEDADSAAPSSNPRGTVRFSGRAQTVSGEEGELRIVVSQSYDFGVAAFHAGPITYFFAKTNAAGGEGEQLEFIGSLLGQDNAAEDEGRGLDFLPEALSTADESYIFGARPNSFASDYSAAPTTATAELPPEATVPDPGILVAGGPGGGLTAVWVGQDGHDYARRDKVLGPDGYQDIHVILSGLDTSRTVSKVEVTGYGGGALQYYEPPNPSQIHWSLAFIRAGTSATADLYWQPDRVETGREWTIAVDYSDGTSASVTFMGGPANPDLKQTKSTLLLSWAGQDGKDYTGLGPAVGPDGFQDAHIVIGNLVSGRTVLAATISTSSGKTWRFGLNPSGDTDAFLVRSSTAATSADLYFSSDVDLFGAPLNIEVRYDTGEFDTGTVLAQHLNPALRVPLAPPIPARISGVTATWKGQDGLNLTGTGDVHLVVSGVPTGRTVAAAMLTNSVGSTWTFAIANGDAFPLGLAANGLQLDVTFQPTRDEAGAALTLRLTFDDGTMSLVQVTGGSVDLSKRAPLPAATTAVASPGMNLHQLTASYGTVRLTAGKYVLSQPLELFKPVSIIGDQGAVLEFLQPASSSPWTAAIKIHAGNTSLEGFSVRFTGPVRWRDGISYGPAVIGTTDNFDPFDAGTVKVNLSFVRLDIASPPSGLQAPPPAGTEWPAEPRLFRLVSAQSGRIEQCVLKGGVTEFKNGPWKMLNNIHNGPQPYMTSWEAFGGHEVHDVEISGNRVDPIAPTGKLWRFLVLTQSGVNDRVLNNTVIGVGPREGDAISLNAPETMLTEGYRVHYEGAPLAVSSDGLILQIPQPFYTSGRSGSGVALLTGPRAGKWLKIVQPLDERTYLLSEPLPQGTTVISIATGFVNETFQGNSVDVRGSTKANALVLIGNLFGTVVRGNTLLGGRYPLILQAAPTEEPVMWGWTRSPSVGSLIDGNTFGPSLGPVLLGVEHSEFTKSTKGRVYFSADLINNVFYPSTTGDGAAAVIGTAPSLDAGENVVTMTNNRPAGTSATVSVLSGTVNGNATTRGTIAVTPPVVAAPGNLRLVNDTGGSNSDKVTKDASLTFDVVSGATSYEYRVGNSVSYTSIGSATTFSPSEIVQGANTVYVRAVGSAGVTSSATSITFTYDTSTPITANAVLDPSTDTGRSASDRVTAIASPLFNAAAASTDTVTLARYTTAAQAKMVISRVGPGQLRETEVLPDGMYQYFLVRIAPAGNYSVSGITAVTVVRKTPPAVSGLTATVSTTGPSAGVSFTPTRTDDWYEYRVNSGGYVGIGASAAFTANALPRGVSAIFVRAVDVAGNIGPDSAVTVNVPIIQIAAISSSPSPATVKARTWVGFTVSVSGTPSRIQWQRANPGSNTFANIANATNANYAVLATLALNRARYRAVVYAANGYSVASAPLKLTVTP